MCGIFFSCSEQGLVYPCELTSDYLARRGPDGSKTIFREHKRTIFDTHGGEHTAVTSLVFSASVLSLRGDYLVEQPLVDPLTGSVLCWNGEAWKFNGESIVENDAQSLFQRFLQIAQPAILNSNMSISSDEDIPQALQNILLEITGPFAFVFYIAQSQSIFYGRDMLGRRSLLQRRSPDGSLLVSSVCHPSGSDDWTEVEAGKICVTCLASQSSMYKEAVSIHNQQAKNFDKIRLSANEKTAECLYSLVQTPQKHRFPTLTNV